MAELRDLHNSTVPAQRPELHEATVLDDASTPGQEIRCVVPSLSEQLASDPMAWTPYVTAEGVFYPKRGDRALLAYQIDGPPLIAWWEPRSAEPDAAIGGLGVIVHRDDPEYPRGNGAHYVWIGAVVPTNAAEFDLLAKYA